MAKWIKCVDNMPENNSSVLCYRLDDGWMVVADFYNDDFYYGYESDIAHAVTHWQELPKEPAKEI